MSALVVGSLIAVALLVFVLSPFWLGPGGLLVASSQLNDPEQIKRLKKIILARYLKDEQAAKSGVISKGEWKTRQQFLSNRYVDLARRYDFLTYSQSEGSKTTSPKGEGL